MSKPLIQIVNYWISVVQLLKSTSVQRRSVYKPATVYLYSRETGPSKVNSGQSTQFYQGLCVSVQCTPVLSTIVEMDRAKCACHDESDETGEDDKVGDNKFEECGRVHAQNNFHKFMSVHKWESWHELAIIHK